jgi:hypothetical protein
LKHLDPLQVRVLLAAAQIELSTRAITVFVVRLIVVDVDTLDSETRRHLLLDREGAYDGPLSTDTLQHLTSLARKREDQDGERLAALLAEKPSLGAFL